MLKLYKMYQVSINENHGTNFKVSSVIKIFDESVLPKAEDFLKKVRESMISYILKKEWQDYLNGTLPKSIKVIDDKHGFGMVFDEDVELAIYIEEVNLWNGEDISYKEGFYI